MTEGERMKRKNYLVLPLALAVLLGAAGCQKQDGAPTAAAEYGSIESLVEDSGTVVHRDPYSIYALVSAKITACHFEEGDAVQEGDILYELDASDLEDQIDQAEVSLKSARQSYDQAASACAAVPPQGRLRQRRHPHRRDHGPYRHDADRAFLPG